MHNKNLVDNMKWEELKIKYVLFFKIFFQLNMNLIYANNLKSTH